MIRKLRFPDRILFGEIVLRSAGCTIYSISTSNHYQILSNQQNIHLYILIYSFIYKLWCFNDGIEKIQKLNLPRSLNFCQNFLKSIFLCNVIAEISPNAIDTKISVIMDGGGQNLILYGLWTIWAGYILVYLRKIEGYYV